MYDEILKRFCSKKRQIAAKQDSQCTDQGEIYFEDADLNSDRTCESHIEDASTN